MAESSSELMRKLSDIVEARVFHAEPSPYPEGSREAKAWQQGYAAGYNSLSQHQIHLHKVGIEK